MSTPILCNNEEITLQKKGLIHWQDATKGWWFRKAVAFIGLCRITTIDSPLDFILKVCIRR